jgi:hypothetical protein
VRMVFEKRFEVVVHLVGDFDVQCTHISTRALRSEDKKRSVVSTTTRQPSTMNQASQS